MIMSRYSFCFFVVFFDTLSNYLFVIVATTRCNATVYKAFHQIFFRYFQCQQQVNFSVFKLQQLIQCLCLCLCTRETIEDKTTRLRVFVYFTAYHTNNYLIRYQHTLIHEVFSLYTQWCLTAYFVAQQVAGRDVLQFVGIPHVLCVD
eukprot:Opistho-1_new@36365